MVCPDCAATISRVVDSRPTGDAIRRRRECETCGARFTTYERVTRRAKQAASDRRLTPRRQGNANPASNLPGPTTAVYERAPAR